jgi:hypothetical protein
MASWNSVKAYLEQKYRVDQLDDQTLKLVFSLTGGRSQVILVAAAGPEGTEPTWLDFHSPIGGTLEVDLRAAVRSTIDFVCGGISMLGDTVTLRTTVPLENLDANEIEDPLHTLLGIADTLERRLTGADRF